MTAEAMDEILGEHALRDGELDRLGFSEIADRIARSIVDRASRDGLVIGIEGRWGSGKSSLIHLIERALNRCADDVKPTVINFRPWLVGNRDALLTSLFNELAEKIARVNLARGDASQITVEKAKKAAEAVRKFGRALGKAGDVVEVAGEAWGPLKLFGKGLKAVGVAAAKDGHPSDLSALKTEITKGLIDLKHRFIITVDDVDRLEPAEAVEVLRLVRSVADFPNIVYLLCYDSERLAEAIQKGANVENGLSFLEKIVQLTVMIPSPEPFELRQWFEEEVSALLGDMPYEVQERLRTVIDQEGETQLRTPRSVVRTLDSLRFFWPAVKSENIDVADLVWLQLIKDSSPALYRWIQNYVADASAISFGTASVTESGKEKHLKALLEAAHEGQLSDVLYRHMLSDILPGVEASYADDGPPVSIHEKVSQRDIQTAIEGRRLASPDHYRIYFSLVGPSHAITQAGFNRFWAALDTSAEDAANLILELHNQKAVGALRKSDVLFERLKSMDSSLWTPLRAMNLLLGLGQMMDSAYRRHPTEDSFIVSSWDRADRLVPVLYAQIPTAERPEVNRQLFAEGRALGWLTSIFRREIFAHGRYGSRPRQPEEWVLPEAEFQAAATIMVERYQSMTIDEILTTPRALHILFAWNQAGDIEGPKNLIAASTQDDGQLVRVLGAFISSINSSYRGRYAVLKRENMEPFMDFDIVVNRLTSIARSAEEPIKGQAAELIGYVNDGEAI